MRIRSTIGKPWRWLKYQRRVWRSRCRRGHATFALVVLLSLGLFEPLLCIIHCQFWIPFALQHYAAPQHHSHLMSMGGSGMAGMQHGAGVALAASPMPSVGCPQYRGHSSDAPIAPPPSPIHDLVLSLTPPLLVLLMMARQLAVPLTGPPRVFIPVPLRPPIPIAG